MYVLIYLSIGLAAYALFVALELYRYNSSKEDVLKSVSANKTRILITFILFILLWPWLAPFVVYDNWYDIKKLFNKNDDSNDQEWFGW